MGTEQSTYLQRLGQFFHDVRVGRGVKLREAAGDWSVSTLSRFERGEHDISADKGVELMARLGLEDTDFLSFYNRQPGNLPVLAMDAALSYEPAMVVRRRAAYFAEHPERNTLTSVVATCLNAAEHWREPDFRFSDAEEQLLADRLAVPEHYAFLEVAMLKVIGGPASHELLTLLWQRIERMGPKWPYYGIRLLMVWLGAIMDRDMPLIDGIEAKLTPIFTHYAENKFTLEYLPNWAYGQAAVRWLRDPTAANAARIQQLIDDLMVMGAADDAHWFNNMFTRMQHAHVRHNDTLVDHPLTLAVSHTLGQLLQNQRHYFGLSLRDISQGFSVSALRRFEAGATQIAFAGLMRLMGSLGLQPSQYFTYLGRTDRHPLGVIGLRATYIRLKHYVPDSEQPAPVVICQQFVLQIPEKPQSVLSVQMLVLYTVAGLALPVEISGGLQAIFTLLMQSNQWQVMEMLAAQALVHWLAPEQIVPLFQHGHRLLVKSPEMLGGTYFFEGLNYALVHVTKTSPHGVARMFLKQFDWLPRGANFTPGAWTATGSWLFARALISPGPKAMAACRSFVARSRRVGHLDAVDAMQESWGDLVPEALFKREC
ncbi:helix-turn-helix domain-containing protein [Lacticaseibacillus thailandensis]|nr:helix-turn-helix transcriptional regulator [Lacticaseibacillus thailandensis]